GVNGAMYAVKSIDINAQNNAGHLKVEISEYESVIERLNKFASSRGLSSDHQYHLVFEEYKGNNPSLLELVSILKQDNMPLFKVSSDKDLNEITSVILENKAKKFSESLMD
nr:hypothetical protein [Bacteroidota bacterium]